MLARTHLLGSLLTILLVAGLSSPTPSAGDANDNKKGIRFQLFHRHGRELLGKTIAPEDHPAHFGELAHIDRIRKKKISAKIHARRKTIEKEEEEEEEETKTSTPPSSFDEEDTYLSTPITAGADFKSGLYYTTLRVGTPPQEFRVIVDSGSDLTWVKCRYRCRHCPKVVAKGLKDRRRVFKADKSSSFAITPCSSDRCATPPLPFALSNSCFSDESPCEYAYRYLQGEVGGFFANESATVTMSDGKDLVLKDLVIGCTTWHEGTDSFEEFDGLLAISFDMQSFLAPALFRFGPRLSYCLVDHLSEKSFSNHIFIGNIPTAPPDLSYTELDLIEGFHAIKVEGVSVDGKRLPIPAYVWNQEKEGGVILDTGSTLTYFPTPAYDLIFKAMKKPLKKAFGERKEENPTFEYCFDWDEDREERELEKKAPRLVIHMKGGALFKPHVKSFILDAEPRVKCLGIVPVDWPGLSMIGNIFQQNFFWEIDIEKRQVGFAPSNCDH